MTNGDGWRSEKKGKRESAKKRDKNEEQRLEVNQKPILPHFPTWTAPASSSGRPSAPPTFLPSPPGNSVHPHPIGSPQLCSDKLKEGSLTLTRVAHRWVRKTKKQTQCLCNVWSLCHFQAEKSHCCHFSKKKMTNTSCRWFPHGAVAPHELLLPPSGLGSNYASNKTCSAEQIRSLYSHYVGTVI